MSIPSLRQKVDAQASTPCWHRVRAICVSKLWNTRTEHASTTFCGKLLYTSTIEKMDLLNKDWCAETSTQWPYNCLSCPMPRPTSNRSVYHGNKRVKVGWHFPRTRLCKRPRAAMFRLRRTGAKLNSRKAWDWEIPSSRRNRFCAWSNLQSKELQAWK